MDRLRNGVEPFDALFCPPARHHSTAVHKACPYMVIVCSVLLLPPSLFLSMYIYLSMLSAYTETRVTGGKFGNHSDFWQGSQQQQRHEHKNNTSSENCKILNK